MSWAKRLTDAKDPSDWAYLSCAVFSCGYSQPKRANISESRLLQGTAETDCSYGVNWWLYKGGFLDECVGFSTRTMIDYLESYGFTLYNAGAVDPQRNDVLWRSGHTAMYIGNGLQAEALRTERGDAGYSGSTPGDQDGGETVVRAYPAGGWTYILRPPAQPEPPKEGWIKEDGRWRFYVNGEIGRNVWAKWEGDWWYMGADGYAIKSQWLDDDGWYYFDAEGKMLRNALAPYKDGMTPVGDHGKAVKDGTVTVNAVVKGWYVQPQK